ncbi:MAG TPA: PQQ-binding-like beta-propeller repeat protein [Polyangiales bacterium]
MLQPAKHRQYLAVGLTALLEIGCAQHRGLPPKPDAGSAASTGPSWNMMGYDAHNNYNQPDESALSVDSAPNVVENWRFTVHGTPEGSPAIAEGKVFVMATGGTYALDFDSGAELWERLDISGTSSLAYGGGFVYAHTGTGANLYKLKASDGSTVWGPVPTYPQLPGADGTSSPVLADGKVLVGHSSGAEVLGGDDQTNARGGVEAFDTNDGSRLWTYWTVPETGENGAMIWSTVSVDLDARVVFAAAGNNYTMGGGHSDAVHAFSLDDGSPKWVQQVRQNDVWSISATITPLGEDTDFGANPILADVDGRKILGIGDKGCSFWAMDRETGEILWSIPQLSDTHTTSNGGVLMNGAFDGQYFYVASNQPPGESILHVIDPHDGSDALPIQMLGATVWGAPSLANGLLIVPANNVLRLYNAKTGDLLNSFDTGGTIAAGAAAIANGKIIVKSGISYPFAIDGMDNNQVIAYGLGASDGQVVDAGMSDASTLDAGGMLSTGAPTFSGVYSDIIQGTGCAGSTLCHGGSGGHLNMTDKQGAYAALVNVAAMGQNLLTDSGLNCSDSGLLRVKPSDPDESLLVQKLENKQPCGSAMPPGGMLTGAQIEQVRMWIQNGAHDD